MKYKVRFLNMAASACLAALSGMAYAGDATQDFSIPSLTGAYTNSSKSYMLALNDAAVAPKQTSAAAPVAQPAEFEPAVFSGSKIHQYLGLGTLALVAATVIAPKPPEIEDRAPTQAELDAQDASTHAKLARAAAAMAAATVTTGLLTHWDDFHVEDGWTDPDNMHVLLGTAGALAMLYAVSKAPGGGHAGAGMAGGAAMVVAVKLTW
jgi:microcystin-dependent protein